ncbi:hypothetical protein Ppa06_58170 [Planomonospora parontospora subsp. parontospora]|uniref:Scaffolding protein n=2 Tax=Planomonospora parontospora TaxID=58119 RepID=A0AA37BM77_9ACTN|nr:hypothetical protein [Planomonospora parontospora]GGK90304.1 hypothetical protein GCM10010126_57140 [Planomonospora parontospora]GII12019.1 hypothetical protein Ppa06_58170 [Planomonospora parontospora subsp. parontospora]
MADDDKPQTEQTEQSGAQPPVEAPPAPVQQEQETERVNPDAKKIDQLPKWAQDELRRARADAVKWRTAAGPDSVGAQEAAKRAEDAAREAAEKAKAEVAQQIGRALGLVADEEKPVDPSEVINKLTTEKELTAKERDAERDRHRRALVELAVHRQSIKHGADPDALLDSRSFLKQVRDLDPDGEGFMTTLTETITKAVEDNPKFKAAAVSGPPARSGGEFTGGPGRSSDPEQMTTDDFRRARRKPPTTS